MNEQTTQSIAQQILILFLDKFFIGLLILAFGYWLNLRLERIKGQIGLSQMMAGNRAKAYEDLWKMTEPFAYSKSEILKRDEQEEIRRKLVSWYYDKGNAMYLSLNATDLFLKGIKLLPVEQTDQTPIKNIFSELRTQLKVDTGAYTQKDAKVKLPKDS